VSVNTVRAAIVHLTAEGLVVAKQGRGVFVQRPKSLRRLSDDIVTAEGFYTMVTRQGDRPTTKTEVRREPATEEVADTLGVEVGAEVVVRARLMGTAEHPLVSMATSYFPLWVVEAAPNLADPTISGLPKWLREAFGDTYSDDLLDARMPTEEERERLAIDENWPVIILKGTTRDSQHRVLHFIDKVTVAGRLQYSYRFGVVPES
jgi:GntR family transcriptional regulator